MATQSGPFDDERDLGRDVRGVQNLQKLDESFDRALGESFDGVFDGVFVERNRQGTNRDPGPDLDQDSNRDSNQGAGRVDRDMDRGEDRGFDHKISGDIDRPRPDRNTLYRRLGGAWAVDVAVELFYRKVVWDKRIAHFFNDVDMDEQIAKLVSFLTMVFGGPSNYSGRDLAEVHRHLVARGMTDQHVDVVVDLLADTLRLIGASEEDVAEVTRLTEATRDDVMGRRGW